MAGESILLFRSYSFLRASSEAIDFDVHEMNEVFLYSSFQPCLRDLLAILSYRFFFFFLHEPPLMFYEF